MSLENTWKRVKAMAENKSHKSTEEVMLRSLGVDQEVLEKIEVTEQYALCRCGQSNNQPMCDGTHKSCNFKG